MLANGPAGDQANGQNQRAAQAGGTDLGAAGSGRVGGSGKSPVGRVR